MLNNETSRLLRALLPLLALLETPPPPPRTPSCPHNRREDLFRIINFDVSPFHIIADTNPRYHCRGTYRQYRTADTSYFDKLSLSTILHALCFSTRLHEEGVIELIGG